MHWQTAGTSAWLMSAAVAVGPRASSLRPQAPGRGRRPGTHREGEAGGAWRLALPAGFEQADGVMSVMFYERSPDKPSALRRSQGPPDRRPDPLVPLLASGDWGCIFQ
jgi:hypothetical protein